MISPPVNRWVLRSVGGIYLEASAQNRRQQDLADLDPEEQQKRIKPDPESYTQNFIAATMLFIPRIRAAYQMALGTLLAGHPGLGLSLASLKVLEVLL